MARLLRERISLASVGTKVLSSAKSGASTGLLLSRECSSHVTTYFRTFVGTIESILVSWLKHSRGSNRLVSGPMIRMDNRLSSSEHDSNARPSRQLSNVGISLKGIIMEISENTSPRSK